MNEQDSVHAAVADAARQTRAVLAEIADPTSELVSTPAARNRLEGAALALDAVAAGQPDAAGAPSSSTR
ncbi:hypothetical protein [Pseudonocardia sp. ICBG601]|uniref:hypothetical protein n=1 Tax=Pseudonocardia sp. ICBG601 TaxID=2846759 RepID=UPI001CF644F2|nr:hypothetical protein [Pseudonocardia sp. ICBG601]